MRLLIIRPKENAIEECALEHRSLASYLPLPEGAFFWLAAYRENLESRLKDIVALFEAMHKTPLPHAHQADFLNEQCHSHFEATQHYQMLAFHQLLELPKNIDDAFSHEIASAPVRFLASEKLLISVHPIGSFLPAEHVSRLMKGLSAQERLFPTSPKELMLQEISFLADGFWELRRHLSHYLEDWQTRLLAPSGGDHNWQALLQVRKTLHLLEDLAEDQAQCLEEFLEAIDLLDASENEREKYKIPTKDILGRIYRFAKHVDRLEQGAETAVQLLFNAQSARTNDVMRTLTVLTAIFLPLNLITGIFGMNFDVMPTHNETGFFITLSIMGLIVFVLCLLFWKKRYFGDGK